MRHDQVALSSGHQTRPPHAHTPADAEGLPALLDAIADSAAVPAATE